MMLASQFSLEEENFYKDIQDLVKKGSQNETELSTFLQRYMDLLTRADIDDETFIINFTKAALILEASTKVYGTKVDRLWTALERVLEGLKANGRVQNNKKKGETDDDVEDVEGEVPADDGEAQKKLPNPRRRKKFGDALSSPDDFLEIDNISGLLGKNMNENDNNNDIKIKFHEEIPNLFIRNKTDRKRIDVCLVETLDDRDDSRLRDWIVSEENMLVKEKYIAENTRMLELSVMEREKSYDIVGMDCNFDVGSGCNSDNEMNYNEPADTEQMECDNGPDDTNNNVENLPDVALQEQEMGSEKYLSTENRDKVVEAFNKSQEVDVGKFPNIYLKRLEDCLVDVNEVFWNSTRFQDVIPSRKMRVKKPNKLPCRLCIKKKRHVKKGKRCLVYSKNQCLDSYFDPLVQPTVTDPLFGISPDEELYNAFKIETKLIEQLGKVDKTKNIYDAYHLEDEEVDEANFLGFDGFESYLMRRQTAFDDCDLGEDPIPPDDDDLDNLDYPEPEADVGLPLPATENGIRISTELPDDACSGLSDAALEESRIEYQNITAEELKNQEDAVCRFERNKELGMKIANWHSSLVKKIEQSQKRGALNVDLLARKILNSFPEGTSREKPVISFQELVNGQSKRDIPRYFFACLQLTNEGNIDIIKTGSDPLSTESMVIKQLRGTRVRQALDEYTNSSPPKKIDQSRSLSQSSHTPCKRKRDESYSSDSLDEEPKEKKTTEGRSRASQKERKKIGLNSENNSRKRHRENIET